MQKVLEFLVIEEWTWFAIKNIKFFEYAGKQANVIKMHKLSNLKRVH